MFQAIHRYEEQSLGLPYAVVLIDGAEAEIDDATGETVGISVHAVEKLAASVAMIRALDPLQLDGREVRFIRRVIGMSAKDFAESLPIDPATFSRWENNKQIVGEWADKQVRMAALIALRDRAPHLTVDPKEVIRLRVRVRQPDEWPHLEMRWVHLGDVARADAADTWDTMPIAA